MRPLRVDRESDPPVYEPTDYAWIDEPTAKCDSDFCYNWFDVSRKTCPMCCYPRKRRKQ